MISKQLWDDAYLTKFAKSLHIGCPTQFWSYDKDGELEELKAKHIRKLMRSFYPALGVFNLRVETNQNGRSVVDTIPVFKRGCRIEEIDAETIHAITKVILMEMKQPLGDDLIGLFQTKYEQVWGKNALKGLKVLPNMEPNKDTLTTCARYFQNGWVEITKDGVSDLKSYDDVDDNLIVWNTSVIGRDYISDKQALENKLEETKQQNQIRIQKTISDQSKVGSSRSALFANLEQSNVVKKLERSFNAPKETHFKDFVHNICSDETDDEGKGIVNQKALDNIELAIGFLCHRYNQDSNRRWVVFVDKFYDGVENDASNGGTGKSALVKCLGHVMNLVELSGRTITSKADNKNMWSRVNRSHELVLIDDCSKKFPTDLLLTNTTGDFHIEGKYKKGFSIPAKSAPKIVLTSNFPLQGQGSTYTRREFICEVSNFYLMQSEFHQSPNTLHGHKDLCGEFWNHSDWTEFYKYIFECISKYLAKGSLPKSVESDFYRRAKLIELVGNEQIFEYLLKCLDEYHNSGEEVFVIKFYADVRSMFPVETQDIKDDKFYYWLKEIGKSFKMYVNKHKHGKQDQKRLTPDRWKKWIADGLQGMTNGAGKPFKQQDQVWVFKVSSPTKPNGHFYPKPNFNKGNP